VEDCCKIIIGGGIKRVG